MVKDSGGPTLEECEAFLNQADMYQAETSAIVASWGYDVQPVQTREERDAAFKKLHEEINGPEDKGVSADERKWRNDPLRKSMGLQASKPRNKPTKMNNKAGEESSEEEEGRSGLGKKRARASKSSRAKGREEEKDNAALVTKRVEQDYDTAMADVDTQEGQRISSPRDPEANTKKVQSWNQETARALADAEDAELETGAQDSMLRNSVRAMFENQELSKSSKKRKFADSSDAHMGDEHSPNKLPDNEEREDKTGQDHKEEEDESAVGDKKSKKRRRKEKRHRDKKAKEEAEVRPKKEEEVRLKQEEAEVRPKNEEEVKLKQEEVKLKQEEIKLKQEEVKLKQEEVKLKQEEAKLDSSASADAEARARARQLAREKLGSGSSSQPNNSNAKSKKKTKKKSKMRNQNTSFA